MSNPPQAAPVSPYGTIAITALVSFVGAWALPAAIALWDAAVESRNDVADVATAVFVLSAFAATVLAAGALGSAFALYVYLTRRQPEWGWWMGVFTVTLWGFSVAAILVALFA